MSNPFLGAQEALRNSFYLQYGKELKPIIMTVYVLSGLNFPIILATLVLRWRSGQFWLFRTHQIRAGKLVSPNPLITWLLLSLVFFAYGLYYNYRTYQAGIVGTDLTNYSLCLTTPWFLPWIGGWIWAWSQVLAPFISPPNEISTAGSSSSYIPRLNPIFLTIFYPISLVVCVSIWLTLGIRADIKFNELYALFPSMDAMLGAAALAFENKIAPTAAEETFLATALAGFNTTFEQFTDRWIAVWVGGVVLDVFYFFVFMCAVLAQWPSLRRVVRLVQAPRTSVGDTQASRHMQRLLWSYRSFLATTVLIAFYCAGTLCFLAPLVIRSVSIKALKGGMVAKVLRLGSLLFSAVLNTGINCILLGLAIMNFDKSSSTSLTKYRSSGKQFGTGESGLGVTFTVDVELRESGMEKR